MPIPAGGIHFVGDQRPDRTESVEALGAGPLAIFLLQVSGGYVVGDGVTANIVARVLIGTDFAASIADDDRDLAFEINPLGELRDADRLTRGDERGWSFEEEQRFGRDLIAQLGGVLAIVASDADNL